MQIAPTTGGPTAAEVASARALHPGRIELEPTLSLGGPTMILIMAPNSPLTTTLSRRLNSPFRHFATQKLATFATRSRH